MGLSWADAKRNFEAYLQQVKAGKIEFLYDPRLSDPTYAARIG